VTLGDWILVGVGIAQALFLALAALFAWLTYRAAKREREAARLQPVITETQVLAQILEEFRTSGSDKKLAEVLGQQERLRISLDFLPLGVLPATNQLARLGREALVGSGQIEVVRQELKKAMQELSPPAFRQL
jgi:hypothetical protein